MCFCHKETLELLQPWIKTLLTDNFSNCIVHRNDRIRKVRVKGMLDSLPEMTSQQSRQTESIQGLAVPQFWKCVNRRRRRPGAHTPGGLKGAGDLRDFEGNFIFPDPNKKRRGVFYRDKKRGLWVWLAKRPRWGRERWPRRRNFSPAAMVT